MTTLVEDAPTERDVTTSPTEIEVIASFIMLMSDVRQLRATEGFKPIGDIAAVLMSQLEFVAKLDAYLTAR